MSLVPLYTLDPGEGWRFWLICGTGGGRACVGEAEEEEEEDIEIENKRDKDRERERNT